jgi:hypothetical protein
MTQFKSYNGTIQIFVNGEFKESISKDDTVAILNAQQERIELLEFEQIESINAVAQAEKQSSDDRWAADAANGLLRWGT